MNIPEYLHSLPPGVAKVEYEPESRMENAGTFTIRHEDHTVGTLLRMKLLEQDGVLFAGYLKPHPLERKIVVKLQTRDPEKPTTTIQEVSDQLHREFNELRSELMNAQNRFLGH